MRLAASLIVAAVLAACASSGEGGGSGENLGPLPFPVERGSALPPPARENMGAAPPEGAGAAGLDFGQWRSADPETYAAAFQTRVRTRYASQEPSAIRADLEANGFSCNESGRLECRIEIMERQCAYDWYVVVERRNAEPIAGFEHLCLGAR